MHYIVNKILFNNILTTVKYVFLRCVYEYLSVNYNFTLELTDDNFLTITRKDICYYYPKKVATGKCVRTNMYSGSIIIDEYYMECGDVLQLADILGLSAVEVSKKMELLGNQLMHETLITEGVVVTKFFKFNRLRKVFVSLEELLKLIGVDFAVGLCYMRKIKYTTLLAECKRQSAILKDYVVCLPVWIEDVNCKLLDRSSATKLMNRLNTHKSIYGSVVNLYNPLKSLTQLCLERIDRSTHISEIDSAALPFGIYNLIKKYHNEHCIEVKIFRECYVLTRENGKTCYKSKIVTVVYNVSVLDFDDFNKSHNNVDLKIYYERCGCAKV